MKIGDIIKRNGIDLLVLDFIDGKPFVLAMSSIQTLFDQYSNDYKGSTLQFETEKWFNGTQLRAIKREIILHSNDKIFVSVAPLTIDEYQKYSDIIKPHIKHSFWLVTSYMNNPYVGCVVVTEGGANYVNYWNYGGLAPAFILDESSVKENSNNESQKDTIIELLKEILAKL